MDASRESPVLFNNITIQKLGVNKALLFLKDIDYSI